MHKNKNKEITQHLIHSIQQRTYLKNRGFWMYFKCKATSNISSLNQLPLHLPKCLGNYVVDINRVWEKLEDGLLQTKIFTYRFTIFWYIHMQLTARNPQLDIIGYNEEDSLFGNRIIEVDAHLLSWKQEWHYQICDAYPKADAQISFIEP